VPPTFETVYASCHRDVYALCRYLVGNAADAQDAAQDTFLAVAGALPAFRSEASISTWVHRIAIRCALKVRARSRRAPEPLPIDELTASGDDPRRRNEQATQLAHAMAQLSFEQRTVISLFAIDGLTHAEIAEVLGVPEGTVWSRLHTARKRLAALLSPPDATAADRAAS
jgi:RNA polymerase sigma-70 factor, ECF subfamily